MDYFIIEESTWAWDGENHEDYIARIEEFLGRLEAARRRDEGYLASREWLNQSILNGWTLSGLIWDRESPLQLPREIREELTARIGRLRYWDDEYDMDEIEAIIQSEPVVSPSAVFAHQRLTEGTLFACLPLPGTWEGRVTVEINGVYQLLHFVTNEQNHREFFRTGVFEAKLDIDEVATLAPHAYPDTYFVDDVWRDTRTFVGGYDAVREVLLKFLAAYDNHGRWIFTDDSGRLTPHESCENGRRVPVTQSLIEQRFAALGFDVAPEKPNVGRDQRCRRARERVIEGETLYCEWHLKLMPHQNRVHMHGPIAATNGRAIVAIFCEHLPLP